MHVDEDDVGSFAQGTGGELRIHRGKRIVERIHESAAHRIDDENARARAGVEEANAAPRRTFGIIQRTENPVFIIDEAQDLALIEPMIARGEHVDAGCEQLVGNIARDAETASRVLAIGDDEVDVEPLAQRGELGGEHVAPWPADHIAYEENSHALPFEL